MKRSLLILFVLILISPTSSVFANEETPIQNTLTQEDNLNEIEAVEPNDETSIQEMN